MSNEIATSVGVAACLIRSDSATIPLSDLKLYLLAIGCTVPLDSDNSTLMLILQKDGQPEVLVDDERVRIETSSLMLSIYELATMQGVEPSLDSESPHTRDDTVFLVVGFREFCMSEMACLFKVGSGFLLSEDRNRLFGGINQTQEGQVFGMKFPDKSLYRGNMSTMLEKVSESLRDSAH